MEFELVPFQLMAFDVYTKKLIDMEPYFMEFHSGRSFDSDQK